DFIPERCFRIEKEYIENVIQLVNLINEENEIVDYKISDDLINLELPKGLNINITFRSDIQKENLIDLNELSIEDAFEIIEEQLNNNQKRKTGQ
ncbi:MAG: hypothetical protein ACRCUM_03970, partial [Mycoplasmoidaceae bacterium]